MTAQRAERSLSLLREQRCLWQLGAHPSLSDAMKESPGQTVALGATGVPFLHGMWQKNISGGQGESRSNQSINNETQVY